MYASYVLIWYVCMILCGRIRKVYMYVPVQYRFHIGHEPRATRNVNSFHSEWIDCVQVSLDTPVNSRSDGVPTGASLIFFASH